MTVYQAPAKINLSLLVDAPQPSGYHPIHSLVQTVEWCDRVTVELGEGEDTLEVTGIGPDGGENLVMRAVEAVRSKISVPPLDMTLEKELPVGAGLGGGSSDAAAALLAAVEVSGSDRAPAQEVAPDLGADVPLFLVGGSMQISGYGERVDSLQPFSGFAFAVVVPSVRLATADVYRRWDQLEGPEGEPVPDDLLPPPLRELMPMRNDLLPAALDLAPTLGDLMADIRSEWDTAVCLTGSGSACFGYFPNLEEAAHAASSVSSLCEVVMGVELRDSGVKRVQ